MSQELETYLKPFDVTSYQPLILPMLKQNIMNYNILTSNEGTGGPILIDILSTINNIDNMDTVSLLNRFKSKQF